MVRILDCTLRDGGYVNAWQFDQKSWRNIVKALVKSEVDIIELGYLDQRKNQTEGSSIFCDLNVSKNILHGLAPSQIKSRFCVMVDLDKYPAEKLPQYKDQHISGIRLAFHKEHLVRAAREARKMVEKGFRVYVQPMVTTSYTDDDLRLLAETFNPIEVFAVYIVDSFGLLFKEEFASLWISLNKYLRPDLVLGYHAHNNLQLAYANAIDIIKSLEEERELLIDASIFGMGRGAGNLNTELLMHYLNVKHKKNYDILPLLECIDNSIEAIYRENAWGYSTAYFLSAAMNCHPNYASYLLNKKTLSVVDIEKILKSIPVENKRIYNQSYIEAYYLSSRSVKRATGRNPDKILTSRDVVIIASGPSVKAYADDISQFICSRETLVLALNHVPLLIPPDMFFFSNQKRYDEFHDQIKKENLIVTNNIDLQLKHQGCFVVNYHSLVEMTSHRCENVAVLFLNLLIRLGVPNVTIAGFDGYSMSSNENYSYQEMSRTFDKDNLADQNESVANALQELKLKIKINFLTPSLFMDGKT